MKGGVRSQTPCCTHRGSQAVGGCWWSHALHVPRPGTLLSLQHLQAPDQLLAAHDGDIRTLLGTRCMAPFHGSACLFGLYLSFLILFSPKFLYFGSASCGFFSPQTACCILAYWRKHAQSWCIFVSAVTPLGDFSPHHLTSNRPHLG